MEKIWDEDNNFFFFVSPGWPSFLRQKSSRLCSTNWRNSIRNSPSSILDPVQLDQSQPFYHNWLTKSAKMQFSLLNVWSECGQIITWALKETNLHLCHCKIICLVAMNIPLNYRYGLFNMQWVEIARLDFWFHKILTKWWHIFLKQSWTIPERPDLLDVVWCMMYVSVVRE